MGYMIHNHILVFETTTKKSNTLNTPHHGSTITCTENNQSGHTLDAYKLCLGIHTMYRKRKAKHGWLSSSFLNAALVHTNNGRVQLRWYTAEGLCSLLTQMKLNTWEGTGSIQVHPWHSWRCWSKLFFSTSSTWFWQWGSNIANQTDSI